MTDIHIDEVRTALAAMTSDHEVTCTADDCLRCINANTHDDYARMFADDLRVLTRSNAVRSVVRCAAHDLHRAANGIEI